MTDPQYDDLGVAISLNRPVRRVVSLVPSLTESLAESGTLVGATAWCTHPADLDVARVRGTKNPDLDAIRELRPDLVVANMEENRRVDVERLRAAGVPVWVTRIETVPDALTSLRRLFTQALLVEAPTWLEAAERLWLEPLTANGIRVVIPVWRDPWLVVGSSTFTGDLVERLGFCHVFAAAEGRYPSVPIERLNQPDIDLVLLPDEPYVFSADDGPEAFVGVRTRLVSGRLLTWYGPSLVEAHRTLRQLAREP